MPTSTKIPTWEEYQTEVEQMHQRLPVPDTLWSEVLGLYLGVHEGLLRFFTPEGELVSTTAEAALAERERA